MNIRFTYQFNQFGLTSGTSDNDHIKDMIEQVLFTAPGERVNRPTFGCGLLQLIFAPNSDEMAATTQFMVQSALQQWLSDIIEINAVQVTNEEATLQVTVQYRVRRTQQQSIAQFSRQHTSL